MDAKPKRGRPPKEASEVKAAWVHLRFTPDELDRLRLAAEKAGQSVSDFCRERLLRAGRGRKG